MTTLTRSGLPEGSAPEEGTQSSHVEARGGRYLLGLSMAALGIVFGDIGTSPLYALRECLHGTHGVPATAENVLGILSLIVWSLVVVVSVKYLAYVLRAHNRGEGGILALMALASPRVEPGSWQRKSIVVMGLVGAALLYGDGMITPAISVLSAVEGVTVAAPAFTHAVVPATIVILVLLFVVQKHGTARVGALFGPITLVWFLTLSALGVHHVGHRPEILWALVPTHAVSFLLTHGSTGLLVLGAVFLVVTGGEALYADMGHFGARPIRLTWFAVVLPSLILNYLGQGALLLAEPEAAQNPFFRMVPGWALYPVLVLATLATIIASQALISGVFSITRQATMLGYLPRVGIAHTSAREIGQIYVPSVNWTLMVCTIVLVLGFGSSSRLAAAYGIAVTLTMTLTTLLAAFVARGLFGWSLPLVLAVTAALLSVDLVFLGANLAKVADGGWFPLLVGCGVFILLTTWRRGRELLAARFREQLVPLPDFFEVMELERATRVPGMAVYMASTSDVTPPALLKNFEHNRTVHERVVLLTVVTEDVARVSDAERLQTETLSRGFFRVIARYGFMEAPDVPRLMEASGVPGYLPHYTTYVLGRETVLASERKGMALWREHVFAFLQRNAQPATAFFQIPPARVLEVGSQVEI